MEHELIMGVQHYESASSRAFWQQVFARLRGQSAHLLNYEDARAALNAWSEVEIGLMDIPIEQIVGSVGRHKDFTHTFLPKSAISRDRWSRIFATMVGDLGLPPVELYRLGEVYFVRDGNHRVSVARAIGCKTIQAYVTAVRPVSPNVT